MNLKGICLIVSFISFVFSSYGQLEIYKQDFVKPLRIEPSLSGNFGEPRSTHFHTGLDYRTYKDGKDVICVADGYVSRVLVSPWGYGMALYVNHPNGFTSVYGHLSKFIPRINQFVTNFQYEKHSFAIDTLLPEDMFVFKRGSVIAYSGNTGYSEGPHLHFEMRETKNDNPLNPLESVYHIKDDIAPKVSDVVIYPLSDISLVNGSSSKKKFAVKKNKDGSFIINSSINAGGPIGIGVAYMDKMNGTTNWYGAESVKLFVDNELIYHSVVDRLDFEKQKCKSSVFDYDYLIKEKLNVHKLFVEPNNDLKIFDYLINDGEFYVPEGISSNIRIEISDYSGNVTKVNLNIQGADVDFSNIHDDENKLLWNKSYVLISELCRVEIDSAVLFKDKKIDFIKLKESKYSPVYKVGEENIPLKKDFKVSFYVNDEFLNLTDKMFVVRERQGKFRYIKPEYSQRFISASSSYFGKFYLWVDTIPPAIKPVNISKDKNMSSSKYIEVKIEDNFSGIAEFNMFINDSWVLGKYDPRKRSLKYFFDAKMPNADKYTLKVAVKDNTENLGIYTIDFRY
jgi:hypothetical protein